MSTRRKQQAAGRKVFVSQAPAEKEETKVLMDKGEEKTVTSRVLDEGTVLTQDFEKLEKNIVGGGEGASTLAEMQRGFSVDEYMTQAEVTAYNHGVASWFDKLSEGQSYEAPFPGDQVFYPAGEGTAKMKVRFDQENFLLRPSQMFADQLSTGVALSMHLDSGALSPEFPDIAFERKDAHVIMHSVAIVDYNAEGLPFDCEATFLTSAHESNQGRPWVTDDPDCFTVGTFGAMRSGVVHPLRKPEKPVLLYHASLEKLTSPWMSRFMTFNFPKLRELMNTEFTLPLNAEYYRIKAPSVTGSTLKADLSVPQWIVMSFFRYLNFATNRQIKAQQGNEEFKRTVGESALQKTKDGYQFVIYKPAFEKVVSTLHEKVRPAAHMAKLEHMKLHLKIVGGEKVIEKLKAKQALMASLRDEFERDPIVGPVHFKVCVNYIAIPKEYAPMEPQTESATGGKYHTYKPSKSSTGTAGYGSYGYKSRA